VVIPITCPNELKRGPPEFAVIDADIGDNHARLNFAHDARSDDFRLMKGTTNGKKRVHLQ